MVVRARPHLPDDQRLAARNVTIARQKRVLLHQVDLAVAPGEIVHIIGENGCGKSSLLRVLAGDVEPRAGSVLRAAHMAYVPERMVLPGALQARSWLQLLGAYESELPDELDRRCGLLSKGQLQRIALIGALSGAPELVILDEPWSGLDVDARGNLDQALRTAASSGAAVVFTDHSGAGNLLPTAELVVVGGTLERRAPTCRPAASPGLARVILRRDSERHEAQVPIDQRDAYLLRALGEGWGVESVETQA